MLAPSNRSFDGRGRGVSFTGADFEGPQLEQRRGKYEADDVDRLLASYARRYDAVCGQRDELQDRVTELEIEVTEAREELGRYREREQHLAIALLHAEAVAADVRVKAERQAGSMLEEARKTVEITLAEVQTKSDEIVEEARAERDRLLEEILRLDESRTELKKSYRHLLVSALELVDEIDAIDEDVELESGSRDDSRRRTESGNTPS